MHRIEIDRRPLNARKIFCATPGCGQQGELIDRVKNGMAPGLIESRFKQKGWEVGDSAAGDFCPSCVATRQAERRAKKFKNVPQIKLPEPSATTETKVETTHMNGADREQEMSRADRRIIFAKLEEVYESEEIGYKDGWSDSAVAKNLGSHIPLAWVAEVREENFGPTKDNGEVRDMLARVAAIAVDARAVLDDAKAIRADGAAFVEKLNQLMHRCTDIGKKLDGIQATADRIKAYVS